MRSAILLALVTALAGAARAEPCPPSVRLSGDPELVTAIADALGARGIRVVQGERCPSLSVHVASRGARLVVVIDPQEGSSIERTVNEIRTAATVIESFTRTDVAIPLLAPRTIPAVPPAPSPPPSPPRDQPPVIERAPDRRVHLALTASLESSRASDGTTWLGYTVEICIELGPICAAARLRSSKVVDGFDAPGIARDHNELLIGVEVPIALGRLRLAPGFAGGVGRMETRVAGMKGPTGGFVAEVHLSASVPIVRGLAIEVTTGAVRGDYERSSVMAPAEPAGVARAGVGLRYER